jgi:hypothetical protein
MVDMDSFEEGGNKWWIDKRNLNIAYKNVYDIKTPIVTRE